MLPTLPVKCYTHSTSATSTTSATYVHKTSATHITSVTHTTSDWGFITVHNIYVDICYS